MKKGITVQPFIFILTLIVMAFVLAFGLKSFLDIKKTADLTELSNFIIKLEDEVEVFYNFDVGSKKDLNLNLPLNVERICFFNTGERINVNMNDDFFRAVLESSRRDNVFVLPLDAFSKVDFYVDGLRVDNIENPLCFNVKGKLMAEIETILYNNNVYVQINRL